MTWWALSLFVLAAVVLLWLLLWRPRSHPPQEYVLEPGNTSASRLPASLGGVPWDRAPLPRRGHTCWVQTKYVGKNVYAGRCPCGAWTRDSGKTWSNRNSRRPGRHRG